MKNPWKTKILQCLTPAIPSRPTAVESCELLVFQGCRDGRPDNSPLLTSPNPCFSGISEVLAEPVNARVWDCRLRPVRQPGIIWLEAARRGDDGWQGRNGLLRFASV